MANFFKRIFIKKKISADMGLDPRYGGGYGAVEPSAPDEPPAYTPRRFGRTIGGPNLLPSMASFSPSRRSSPPASAPGFDDTNDWAGASRHEQEEAFALLPRQSSGQYRDAASASATATAATAAGGEEGPVGDWQRASVAPGGYMGVAKLLVGVYAILMGAMIYTNGGIEPTNVNPMQGPSIEILNSFGANNAAEIKYNNEWWRILSPIVLHAGIIHLAFNAYFQWTVGAYLEAMWGYRIWFVIYLIGGIFGNLCSACAMPDVISVGASGSIMGLIGAWLVELLCHWSDDRPSAVLSITNSKLARKQRIRNLVVIIVNLGITFAMSVVPMVDWAAHLGGWLGGTLVAMCIFAGDIRSNCCKYFTRMLSIALGIGVLLVLIVYFLVEIEPNPDLLKINDDNGNNGGGMDDDVEDGGMGRRM